MERTEMVLQTSFSEGAGVACGSERITARGAGVLRIRAEAVCSGTDAANLTLFEDGVPLCRESLSGGRGSLFCEVETFSRRFAGRRDELGPSRPEHVYYVEVSGTGTVRSAMIGIAAEPGIRLTSAGCCQSFEGTLYLLQGGEILAIGQNARTRLPALGPFRMMRAENVLLKCSLGREGILVSSPESGVGTLLLPGASAFCTDRDELFAIRGGELLRLRLFAGASCELISKERTDAENLRFIGGELLLERGGASFRRRSGGGFEPFCPGVRAAAGTNEICYARGGKIFRRSGTEESLIGAGEEAVYHGGVRYLRSGGNVKMTE